MTNRPAAQRELAELNAAFEAAQRRVGDLRTALGPSAQTFAPREWDDILLHEQRALICATIDRIEIRRGGNGFDERVKISPRKPFGE